VKVEERPRAACSDGCELAEEKKLDMLSAAVERHLSGNQEDACRLGDPSMYMFFFSRRSSSRPFSLATIAMTCIDQ